MSKKPQADEKDLQKGTDSPTIHFINHESRISRIEAVNEMILSSLLRLESKVDSNFKWTLGIMVTTTIALIGTILHKG